MEKKKDSLRKRKRVKHFVNGQIASDAAEEGKKEE
jgi:hypothetical protein